MKTPNPQHIQAIMDIPRKSPYPALLGMRFRDIGAGYARMELDLETKHTQLLGLVHGGVLAALMDNVTFWSVWFGVADPDAWLVTVDLKINYLAPARCEKLLAAGRQIKAGTRLCYADGEIRDENQTLLAHGTATLMVYYGGAPGPELKLPPKFLD